MLPISNNRLGSTNKDQSDTVSHKSQHCLTLSTNSNYIQHVCNDASSPMYSGTRNSSVSINYPDSKEEANDLLLPNQLMPPRDPCASRLSTSSAWNSIRLSALSLSRVFFLKPCSKHKCCLGCISLRDAIPLICTVEMFSLVFCTTIAIDFWISNGKSFYTVNFEGYGTQIALGYLAFLLISIGVLLFTISIWKSKRRNWYIVHIIWQWTIIELFGFFIYMVVTWARNAEKQSILMPSAYVLIGATSFGALVEIWWLIIFVDAMLFEKSSDSYGSRRTSNENREDLEESESSNSPTSIRPNIKITENCEIVI
ncbi:hypothetical protein CRE_17097 [Caenorhabditis remanei]|uniref:Uncharacterized protein n=1 Tax=Caenorhabditis remanei TaxID=31234 RepID=E3MA48_CAERE|nr:hypothetical protein CRE_17097 [Caenorhabditis remanei]